jgi:hypothetical protein
LRVPSACLSTSRPIRGCDVFDFKQFGGFFLSTVMAAVGTWVVHTHPEWGAFVVPLVGFLTHHSGKEAGKSGGNGTAP